MASFSINIAPNTASSNSLACGGIFPYNKDDISSLLLRVNLVFFLAKLFDFSSIGTTKIQL